MRKHFLGIVINYLKWYKSQNKLKYLQTLARITNETRFFAPIFTYDHDGKKTVEVLTLTRLRQMFGKDEFERLTEKDSSFRNFMHLVQIFTFHIDFSAYLKKYYALDMGKIYNVNTILKKLKKALQEYCRDSFCLLECEKIYALFEEAGYENFTDIMNELEPKDSGNSFLLNLIIEKYMKDL